MPKGTKKSQLKKNRYTLKQKRKICKEIYDISDDDVLEDFNKLKVIGCSKHKTLSLVGNDVVNKFTAVERLNTVGNKGINFYDVLYNKKSLLGEGYVKNVIRHYKKNNSRYPETKVWFRLSNLYFSSVSVFKPLVAMSIYCKYKPTCILDFTMGWGGRLVGACALDVPKYIGIDNNKNLELPYSHMTTFLKSHSTTDIDLRFQDALTVDYSKLTYDMVLTSPPYYNIEIYGNQKQQSKAEWDEKFYKPVFAKTFQNLQKGGHYCLNIPVDVYDNVAFPMFGKPFAMIPLPKAKRSQTETYKEYIYVWRK
jgi:hypothetical protein